LSLSQLDVARSVRNHFETEGYTVSTGVGRNQTSVEITATKGKDIYIIEAVGESAMHSDQTVVFAVGKIVKRMQEQGFWLHYGVALPKTDYRLLGDFEAAGFEALNLHLFLVDSLYTLIHLHPQDSIGLLSQLKQYGFVNFTPWIH
jgi:hypothetical protein